MSHMQKALITIADRMNNDDGQALAEFALILGLIAVICIVAITALGGIISKPFTDFIAGLGG